MGALRQHLSPYFHLPYPGMSLMNSARQHSNVRLPEVVDLLTSPDETANSGDTQRAENPNNAKEDGRKAPEVQESDGNSSKRQDTGKQEVLKPQSLCDEYREVSVSSESTAAASEKPVLRASGSECEISRTNAPESTSQREVAAKITSGARDANMSNEVSKAVAGSTVSPVISDDCDDSVQHSSKQAMSLENVARNGGNVVETSSSVTSTKGVKP